MIFSCCRLRLGPSRSFIFHLWQNWSSDVASKVTHSILNPCSATSTPHRLIAFSILFLLLFDFFKIVVRNLKKIASAQYVLSLITEFSTTTAVGYITEHCWQTMWKFILYSTPLRPSSYKSGGFSMVRASYLISVKNKRVPIRARVQLRFKLWLSREQAILVLRGVW